ncbi:uncharacterized protein LOC143299585 [Babylonia areolata]|uniref:uncharacterized protein LOC143299585 n=1 Tax=Babylonia areolata TaxID=304850 RepID=UPI003FD3DA2E
MRFNAQKCHLLSIKSTSSYLYSLGGVILKQAQETPYLGVQIASDLKWSPHISNISCKAGSTIGFLRWNLRNCPKDCRRLAYTALVRSKLEYSATVWDPHQRQDIEKLERVQRQIAHFITGDYKSRNPGCVSGMLKELNLPPLEERRRHQHLSLFYKIAEGVLPDNS